MENSPVRKAEKDWINIVFLTLTPIIGLGGTALYTWKHGFHWWMAILFVVMYLCVGLSICGGYHRLFSHKSYECSPIVQVFYAIFGAMAAQNSILWWCAAHRIHHKYVDRDWDPYNIQRGFWWAHILWIFYRNPDNQVLDGVPDLVRNPVVAWQHKWNKWILLAGGFGIPTAIGAMFGDPIAGLLWGGFLRVVVIHQTTFFVNSLAHKLGERRYAADVSARDNWLVALVTLGEGYHSFHHKFPADFRNGIHWYQWDPAKWMIRGLRSIGLARDLKSTPAPLVEQARLSAAYVQIESRLQAATGSVADEIRERVNRARESAHHAYELWKQHAEERRRGMSSAWKSTRREALARLKEARREWRGAVRLLSALPKAA
jgi:stearoyl-CoA desaturase (delta-9 desaturase)